MNTRRNIALLGSTGSIGRSSLEVLAGLRDRFCVTYLTAHKNIDLLQEQVLQFHPRGVVVLDECNASVMRTLLGETTEVLAGEEGLMDIVQRSDVDLVLSALVGFAGVKPTFAAIDAGKDIALANKETLVVAGELIMKKVREKGVRLLPIDSEHSAIHQCLRGEDPSTIERLILTASGGPFLHLPNDQFETVSVSDALHHPTWRMGNKISIDSATLMNKGLEVIEAFRLFGVPPERIEVVIHPQSIIHSLVEFVDGSVKAQMGIPDMKLPIHYALTYPDRPASTFRKLDLAALQQMTFMKPDTARFRCLTLAYDALKAGGTTPTVLNAANEVAVQQFLDGQIPFSAIPQIIEDAMRAHVPLQDITLDDVIRIDKETREQVRHHAAIT